MHFKNEYFGSMVGWIADAEPADAEGLLCYQAHTGWLWATAVESRRTLGVPPRMCA